MFRLGSKRFVSCVIVAFATAVTSSAIAAPPLTWPNACGDGRVDAVVDGFEEVSTWGLCCSDGGLATVGLRAAPGCSEGALAVEYDLNGGDWFVIWRSFDPPVDVGDRTHLRLAMRSSDKNAHHNVQIKLVNQGPSRELIYWMVAQSIADLPVWRPLYFDLREFTCFGDAATCATQSPLDSGAITRIELGVGRCRLVNGDECERGVDQATLFLDELAAVDLRPGATHRLVQAGFQWPTPDPDLRASTAGVIEAHQQPDAGPARGLVPAWFDQADPEYNIYAQAIALHVLVDEYERTGDSEFKTAANRLAEALLDLQIPEDKLNSGAWFTAYGLGDGALAPLGAACRAACTGDETATQDIDCCSWIANTAWAVIGLNRLRHSEIGCDRPAALDASIARAVSWMKSQIGRIGNYPELITVGLEGNISSYFGLLAGQEHEAAEGLGNAIYERGWDPEQQRMKIGAGPADFATAMDAAGSWGTTLLRCLGKETEALSSQGYAATVLRTTSFDSDNVAGRIVEGYGDIAGPFTITSEFGAQAAAVGILGSSHVMEELSALNSEGAFPGSTDRWFGGQVAPWTTTWTGVAPTAWVYFAQNGDPLLPLCSVGGQDEDLDGWPNRVDNCPTVANPGQVNTNASEDGYGNICDPDLDNDGDIDGMDRLMQLACFRGQTFHGFDCSDADLTGASLADEPDPQVIQVDGLDRLQMLRWFRAPGTCPGDLP